MTSMHIRRLIPTDAAEFHSLRLAGLRDAPIAFGASYDEEQGLSVADIEARLQHHEDRGVFGAFVNGALVGVVALGRERQAKLAHKGMIWGVYVAPAARGTGAGRALMAAVIDFAKSVPALLQLNLVVYVGNAGAIKLYESLGFEIYGREPNAIRVDGVLYDDFHMRLELQR
jgi:RimJ/RimL family protein N-acetyltransferase